MADATSNILTISFPEEAYKLLPQGNAANTMNYQHVVLNVNYFEDVNDEEERKAEAPPEIVARSIRLPLDSPGITTVVVGKPEEWMFYGTFYNESKILRTSVCPFCRTGQGRTGFPIPLYVS